MLGSRGVYSRITVDIVFDAGCPWCFIGKRTLAMALVRRPSVRAELRWHPFVLNPDIPPQGISYHNRDTPRVGLRTERMLGAARSAGLSVSIQFVSNAMDHIPATIDAHRLIRLIVANTDVSGSEAVEAVMSAYFIKGLDIGDPSVLADIGQSLGFPRSMIEKHLADNTDISGVLGNNHRAHRLGINGVPCFIFNDAYAVAGAQNIEVFLRLIDLAAEEATTLARHSSLCME